MKTDGVITAGANYHTNAVFHLPGVKTGRGMLELGMASQPS